MTENVLKKGAEAYIYLEEYFDRKVIRKVRVPKSYRVDKLDRSLREKRSRKEAKLLYEAKKAGVPTPVLMTVWPKEYTILMEYIEGELLKDYLLTSNPIETKITFMESLGSLTGDLHKNNLIHGDLTTSNVLITSNDTLCMIDFGLGGFSTSIEKKGEEIRVLLGSLLSVHYKKFEEYFNAFEKGYKRNFETAGKVIERTYEIAKRGRYTSFDSSLNNRRT